MPRIAVKSLKGGATKDITLPDAVYGAEVNTHLVHEAVVAYQAAGRRGTHATKNRSDVRGGGKKPWKQKKTGRARHGSIRSPIWKGGGTVFGPQPRDYSQALPRRKRQGALRAILSAKVRDGRLVVVDSLDVAEAKTRALLEALKGLGISGSALLLDEPVAKNVELSARNAPGVHTARSTAVSVMDLMSYDTVVLTEAAAQRLAEVLSA
jgi:large subunit ribosomal protein L4